MSLISLPEKIKENEFNKVLADKLLEFSKFINLHLKKNEVQVVVGGDDCVTLSSILSVLARIDNSKKFGYIRVDSHADMNLSASSPTKNFHGMYHRPLFGDFDISEISNIVKFKLNPENVLFIGNLNLDYEEAIFFKKLAFKNITSQDLANKSFISMIDSFVREHDFLHVSIDIDAFDRSIAPATGIPAKSGLLLSAILPIIEHVSKHKNLSIDLVEVNPKKEGAEKTIQLAWLILEKLLLTS